MIQMSNNTRAITRVCYKDTDSRRQENIFGCQAASLTRRAGCQPSLVPFRQAGSLAAESAKLADIRFR